MISAPTKEHKDEVRLMSLTSIVLSNKTLNTRRQEFDEAEEKNIMTVENLLPTWRTDLNTTPMCQCAALLYPCDVSLF